jgi:hypothetical protein
MGVLLLLCGCATPLPTYQWQGADAAVTTLAQKAQSIRSVRATGTLVLTSADNQHVTLDAAIVAKSGPQDHAGEASLRIRTWKFGQAIFDLTAKPEGLWLASASDKPAEPDQNDRLKALKPENIAQAWNLFFGDFFSRPGLEVIDHPGSTFTVQRQEKGTTIACDIDRATLTARQYRITDDHGHLRQTLTMARYAPVGDPPTPWPMLITAQGDQGQVQVRFDEVEVNPDLEDAVFVPPKRAAKMP